MSDERDPGLAPFAALVGTWGTTATHPLLDGEVPGTCTWEWLAGGRFLIQRTVNDHALVPDAIAVLGAPEHGDGDELTLEYFDSRGVRRTYGAAFEDGVLRFWRDAAGFDQRFSARPEATAFEGRWEVAETPGAWKDDLAVRYRRRASPRR
jgi:hypothetical protein